MSQHNVMVDGPVKESDGVDAALPKGVTLEKLRESWNDSEMKDFTDQPLEGLLYDLDLLPEQIRDPVQLLRARVIEYLYSQKRIID